MTVNHTFLRATISGIFHFLCAWGSAVWYRFPSKKLCVIGVTGTDGKSSSVLLIARILKEQGFRVGYFSSIAYSFGDDDITNTQKMTTPGRGYLQYFLYQLLRHKCTHAVLEITSEGMKQYRHRFIDFDVVTITNITPEHIESHGGFEKYKEAKRQLLVSLEKSTKTEKVCVQNADDPVSTALIEQSSLPIFRYSLEKKEGIELSGEVLTNDLYRTCLRVDAGKEQVEIQLQLGGPFIAQNALCAVAVCTSVNVPLATCKSALEKITHIPGRFEVIAMKPLVIVDYAHTINALEKILPFIAERVSGSLVHVFGAAGGGRDAWKRPKLAGLSERYADISIVTEENPFDEDPEKITQEIIAGFSDRHEWRSIPKREHAVETACKTLYPNDCLVCTAKGSEEVIAGPNRSKRLYNERFFIAKQLATWRK